MIKFKELDYNSVEYPYIMRDVINYITHLKTVNLKDVNTRVKHQYKKDFEEYRKLHINAIFEGILMYIGSLQKVEFKDYRIENGDYYHYEELFYHKQLVEYIYDMLSTKESFINRIVDNDFIETLVTYTNDINEYFRQESDAEEINLKWHIKEKRIIMESLDFDESKDVWHVYNHDTGLETTRPADNPLILEDDEDNVSGLMWYLYYEIAKKE